VLPLRVAFNSFWVLTVWSFLRARYSDPGIVPARWQAFVVSAGPALPIAPARKEWQPRKATMCMKCRFPRPERSHHCALCGVCVMRYDHHCPWINNCVGFYNHKFFIQLSVYAWLTGFLTLLPSTLLVPACIHGIVAGTSEVYRDLEPDPWSKEELGVIDAAVVLSLALLGTLSCMLLYTVLRTHLPLALRNLTSVEDFYENMPNPFNQGSVVGNLAQTFGAPGPDWLVPVSPWKPLSDGVTFPTSPEPCSGDLSEAAQACDCLLERPESSGMALSERQSDLDSDEPSSRSDDHSLPFIARDGSRGTAVSVDLESETGEGEELWRFRYRLHERRGHTAGGSPTGHEPGSPASAPTLLKGLWSSFWRGRKHPNRRGVWL